MNFSSSNFPFLPPPNRILFLLFLTGFQIAQASLNLIK